MKRKEYSCMNSEMSVNHCQTFSVKPGDKNHTVIIKNY